MEVKQLTFEFKSGLRGYHDLRGCLEVAMAVGATKMPVIGNMHMDVRVIEVTELNSEVRSGLRGHYHCRPLVSRAIALLFSLHP